MAKNVIRKWKTLESELVFDHRWYKVCRETVEIHSGQTVDDYLMGVFNDIVLIVAVTRDERIVLVRQYKHGAGKILLEVPAGYIDDNENPLRAAKRELLEETGFVSSRWKKIGILYSNPTKIRGGRIYLFLARNIERASEQNQDVTENIEISLCSKERTTKLIAENKIKVAGSIAGLLLALDFLKK